MPISAGTEIGSHTNAVSATTCVVTLSAGASVGDLVVVSCANDGTTVSSITDNAAGGPNVWDRRVNISTGGFSGVCIAWTIVTAALANGDTITVTAGGTVDQAAHVEKFTGAAASPVDQSQSAGDATGTSTTPTSNATATTTQADDMLFGAGAAGGNNPTFTPAVVSPTWTATTTEAQHDVAELWQHYRNVAATGAYTYNGTFNAGDSYSFGIVAFKAAAAASAVRAGFLPRNTLLRGVRNLGQMALYAERVPKPAAAAPAALGIWLPPLTFPATRNRAFFGVRGRQVTPVPAQGLPVLQMRSPALRREPVLLRRGTRPFPVQAQIPVPPLIPGNRAPAGRRGIAARARRVALVPEPVLLTRTPTPRPRSAVLARPRRPRWLVEPAAAPGARAPARPRPALSRPRRRPPAPAEQASVLARAAARSRALLARPRRPAPVAEPASAPPASRLKPRLAVLMIRGRVRTPVTVSAAAPVLAWPPPKLGAPRRLLTSARRGRQFAPVGAQVPVPPMIPGARYSTGRLRMTMLRRGRQATVVPAQVSVPRTIPGNRSSSARSKLTVLTRARARALIIAPAPGLPPPFITPPTTALIAAYLAHAAVSPYSATGRLAAYLSAGSMAPYFTDGTITVYTASPAIVASTGKAAVVTYTSAARLGPTYG